MKWFKKLFEQPIYDEYYFKCPSCNKMRSFKMFGEMVYREHGVCLGCHWTK